MKRMFLVLSLLATALITGCATHRQVSGMEGQGTTVVYGAPFDDVWRAAVDGVQMNGLEVLGAERASGYITARRTVRAHTFGENVAVWVRPRGPAQTEMEVVSRQAGPPVAWLKNWENEIHRAVQANLTRETPRAVGVPPHSHTYEQGQYDRSYESNRSYEYDSNSQRQNERDDYDHFNEFEDDWDHGTTIHIR